MKSIEFKDGELPDLQAIADKMFADENDPTSYAYKRKLNRPHINWLKISIAFFLPLLLCTTVGICCNILKLPTILCVLIPITLFFVYSLIISKRAAIALVKIYQRYAPDSVRNNCRFEPSCSEYCILAIQKYGFFKGVIKTAGRLKRCNINGGGIDYP